MLTNAFIAVYLFYAWSWNLPENFFLKRAINQFRSAIVWLGLWHSWAMFAPSPILVERRISVQLTFADGSVENHDEVRIHELSRVSAFFRSRERKYQENLSQKGETVHRPALCKYVAKCNTTASRVPIKAELILLKRRIRKHSATEENEVQQIVLWTVNL